MKKTYFTTNSNNDLIINNLTSFSFKSTKQKSSFERYYKKDISKGKDLNKRIKLEGSWILTDERLLKFRILGAESSFLGQYLIFNGSITSPDSGLFGFRIESSSSLRNIKKNTIEIKGSWFADNNNRLSFKVINVSGKSNILRLQGAWKINDNNEMIYEIKKQDKEGTDHTISFKGFWDIGLNKIVYKLGAKGKDYFVFASEIKKNVLNYGTKYIKFSVLVEYYRKGVKIRSLNTVTLNGTWALKNGLKTSFKIIYSNGMEKEVIFSIGKIIPKKGKFTVYLSKKNGEKYLFRLELTKKMSNDLNVFLRVSGNLNILKKPKYNIVSGLAMKF